MTSATTNLIHHALDVNSWAKNSPEVEAARPSHCPRCELAAYDRGRLRLHGHGRRERVLWGPPQLGAAPVRRSVWLRRYRCVECGAVCAVAPRGVAARLRYAATAIASALLLWSLWRWSASKTRDTVSPDRLRGLSEPQRWRSLRRWAGRSAEIFGLPRPVLHGASGREVACRVAHVLIARGPPELDQHRRVVLGALA